ncbi:hypothetical protein niasHT_015897 [Heterodera trifolii]|uniref:Uncharacterized protein n=1 Tax=Heterodera trifolii TaxID=157864 RepID=A0ABD2LK61_9BILA
MDIQKQNYTEQSLELLSQELRSILLDPNSQMPTETTESNEKKENPKDISSTVFFEHQQELLNESVSSGDEDFRCASVTSNESEPIAETESRLLTLTSQMPIEKSNSNGKKENPEDASSTVFFEHQQELLNESVSSGDEDFRCASVTPPESEVQESRLLTPTSQMPTETSNSNGKKENPEDISSTLFIEHQQELLNESVSSGDEGSDASPFNSEKLRSLGPVSQLSSDLPNSNESKTHDEASSYINCKIDAPLIAYSRAKLFMIRNSKTEDGWLSYLSLNHGHHWLIEEMPFQLDRDLRCSFGRQLRVIREREENMKRKDSTNERRQRRRKVFSQINNGSSTIPYTEETERKAVESWKSTNSNVSNNKKKGNETSGQLSASPVNFFEGVELPPFTDNQMNVWFKYLSCINSRIREITEDA